MDPIKEAFAKIKEDIYSLSKEILSIKEQLNSLSLTKNPTNLTQNSSSNHPISDNSTEFPTQNMPLEAFSSQNNQFSSGNSGVSTDKPTNQQTNQHPLISYGNPLQSYKNDALDEFRKAKETLDSLDNIKKEIRRKFKGLTRQEMTVFSTIYGLEEQNIGEISYKMLSKLLNLSESSIRDYINRITKKGIPISKIRQNNKQIILKISEDLKNIASLTTILSLREI